MGQARLKADDPIYFKYLWSKVGWSIVELDVTAQRKVRATVTDTFRKNEVDTSFFRDRLAVEDGQFEWRIGSFSKRLTEIQIGTDLTVCWQLFSESYGAIKSRGSGLTFYIVWIVRPDPRVFFLDQNPNIQGQIIKPFHDARLQDRFYWIYLNRHVRKHGP